MRIVLMTVLATLAFASACSDNGATSALTSPTARQSASEYAPEIDPADFTAKVDNAYFPLVVGTRWVYEAKTEDGLERIVVQVTDKKKKVALGIDTTVVRDTVSLDGEVIEDTYDWYAQDADGNVWYMGEDTIAFEDGKSKKDGSWEAGVDGALPGIQMPADPKVDGKVYQQEFYKGEAEDTGEVIGRNKTAVTPFRRFEDTIVTEDINPFEPDVVENKYYARDVGLVLELHVKGGAERVELVEYSTS